MGGIYIPFFIWMGLTANPQANFLICLAFFSDSAKIKGIHAMRGINA